MQRNGGALENEVGRFLLNCIKMQLTSWSNWIVVCVHVGHQQKRNMARNWSQLHARLVVYMRSGKHGFI